MALDLDNFDDPNLDEEYLAYLVDQQADETAQDFALLWNYYRNPLDLAGPLASHCLNAHSRPYFQAQEAGLPPRITGSPAGGPGRNLTDVNRKEVVIENDIAWRIHAMVDFLFGKELAIRSLAPDANLAHRIEEALRAMLQANGGIALLQEMALQGAIYGFTDLAFRFPADVSATRAPSLPDLADPSATGPAPASEDRPGTSEPSAGEELDAPALADEAALVRVRRAAASIALELIEPPRIVTILDENDYRRLRYWIQRFHKHPARLANGKRSWLGLGRAVRQPAQVEVIEIIGPAWWQRYEDRQLVAQGPNPLGRPCVVHVQNMPLPASYAGLGDVESLIPLQDELNTRLSDRAHRVTYQSFKMYLGKGIDDFLERPVGPGQMWATQNMDASIEEFGSDGGSPSEDAHIQQIRQAMDKVSGVTPLAAGILGGNVGNLSSATALKVLLSGLLAKTARKRLTYGGGLQQVAEMALEWLDRAGVLRTAPRDRRIEIHWPNPLPADELEQLRAAQIKSQLGVPADRVLAELGYERPVSEQGT